MWPQSLRMPSACPGLRPGPVRAACSTRTRTSAPNTMTWWPQRAAVWRRSRLKSPTRRCVSPLPIGLPSSPESRILYAVAIVLQMQIVMEHQCNVMLQTAVWAEVPRACIRKFKNYFRKHFPLLVHYCITHSRSQKFIFVKIIVYFLLQSYCWHLQFVQFLSVMLANIGCVTGLLPAHLWSLSSEKELVLLSFPAVRRPDRQADTIRSCLNFVFFYPLQLK